MGMVWSVVGTGRGAGLAFANAECRDTQGAGMVVRVEGRESRVEGQQNVVRTEVTERTACTAMKVDGQESPGARVWAMSVSILNF